MRDHHFIKIMFGNNTRARRSWLWNKRMFDSSSDNRWLDWLVVHPACLLP